MRDSRDAIEKVLAGLRDAEAPAGMERRILERLEGQVSTVEAPLGWRGLVPAWVMMPSKPVGAKTLICGAALAGFVAVVIVVPAVRRFGHVPVESKAGFLPRTAVRTTPAITAGVAELSSGPSRMSLGMTAKAPNAGLAGNTDAGAAPTEDDVARSEMEAASFPAPPMPLTAQERLLLRLAHKVDPVEMAMLDPKFRAMQDAEEKAEFQRFFGQTAKQASPESTEAEQSVPAIPTTDPVEGKQQEQQQIPSGDDTQKGKDDSDRSIAPVEPGSRPLAPLPATPEKAAPEQAAPKETSPDQTSPEQSRTQHPTATPTGTGEKE